MESGVEKAQRIARIALTSSTKGSLGGEEWLGVFDDVA
jgi:hypothetical protein